jgi:hypothetical protein
LRQYRRDDPAFIALDRRVAAAAKHPKQPAGAELVHRPAPDAGGEVIEKLDDMIVRQAEATGVQVAAGRGSPLRCQLYPHEVAAYVLGSSVIRDKDRDG